MTARFPLLAAAMLAVLLASSAARPQGSEVASVEVVGTEIRVTSADGSVLGSEALVGAVLTMVGRGRRPTAVRIDAVERDPADPEILLHSFSVRDEASGEWRNLCGPDPSGVAKALPMRGALDANAEYQLEAPGFSMSCTSGVQAKCVRWGYKPWWPDPPGVRMIDLFRSCMRMARADYCGDSRPHTVDGTRIDLYDVAGIQRPEPVSTQSFEAAWAPHGAVCLARTRLPEKGSVEDVIRACPRLASMPQPCDETAPGALLFNKS